MTPAEAELAAIEWEGEAGGVLLPQLTANELAGIVNEALAKETVRADYAWRNTRTIEVARQEEMLKRDALTATIGDMLCDMAIGAGVLEKAGDEYGVAWNLRNSIAQAKKAIHG